MSYEAITKEIIVAESQIGLTLSYPTVLVTDKKRCEIRTSSNFQDQP